MKSQYEILNNVTVDFSEYESICLGEQEKYDIKNRIKKKVHRNKVNIRNKVAAAILVFSLVGFLSVRNETVMAAIKIIGIQLSEYIHNQGNNYGKYKTVVGQNVTDKNITIKLNDVIVDDSQLLINCDINTITSLETGTKISDSSGKIKALVGTHLYIDGKEIKTTCYDQTSVIKDGYSNYKAAIDTPNVDLNKTHDFRLVFDTIVMENANDLVNGKWEFKFSADGKVLSEKVASIPIHKQVVLDENLKVNIEEFRITPLSMRLFFNQGKVQEKWISFKAIADNGDEIQNSSLSILSDDGEGKQNFILKQETKKITLVPMIDEIPHYDKTIVIDLNQE